MKIEKASINDNEILTEITKKSKAYWGYSEEQILKWNDNLTISKDYIENNTVYKLVNEDKIIGYYSYIVKEEKNVIRDNLFVLPEFIGKGFGKYLMTNFLNRVKNEGFEKITLDSEPNAENFYLKIGFKKNWRIRNFNKKQVYANYGNESLIFVKVLNFDKDAKITKQPQQKWI